MTAEQATRRGFVRATIWTAAGAAAGALGGWPGRAWGAAGAASDEKPLYAFPFLGDMHYDKLEHHDMAWMRQKMPNDVRLVEGYSKTTRDLTPGLLAEVGEAVRESKAAGTDVPFVIQCGDLVEGCCGNGELATQQCRDATGAVDGARWGVPCLMTKGNHDITGPGAQDAFDKVLLPWMGKQAGRELATASYVMRHGEGVFVFFDAYRPDLDWLDKALAKERGRRVFFVLHMPVVPYNARADWIVFGRDSEQANRRRLLGLLGRYRAIVLSGHLHKYSILSRRTEEAGNAGSFVQLAVCSVLRREHEKGRDVLDGVGQYTPDLVKLEPQHAPGTDGARRALLEAERPFVERFEYADVPGYSMVKVYADRVDVDLYVGLDRDRWRGRELARGASVTG